MIKPLRDFVVIKPDEIATITKSGIHLAPGTKQKPVIGTVVAVNKTPHLKVGDKVLYGKYDGNDVQYDRTEYKIIRIKAILAKLNASD